MFSSTFAFILALVTVLCSLATISLGAPIPVRRGLSGNDIVQRGAPAGSFSGDGTFYAPGLGACGITNSATDLIAAMAYATFDSFPGATGNPNSNPICNQQVVAQYQGKSVTVTITDRCAGCAGASDLDFSPAAFDQLADESVGRIQGVTWSYVGSSSSSSSSSSESSSSSSGGSSSSESSSSSSGSSSPASPDAPPDPGATSAPDTASSPSGTPTTPDAPAPTDTAAAPGTSPSPSGMPSDTSPDPSDTSVISSARGSCSCDNNT